MNELAERVNKELIPIYNYDDEYDIIRKFKNALELGKEIADNLILCEKNNNQNMINFYNNMLSKCYNVFNGHFWGENYKNELDIYVKRKKLGKISTVEHTNELKEQIIKVNKKLETYIKSLYPLEMPEYRNAKENEYIEALETEIKKLKKQFNEEYAYLSQEEKNTIDIDIYTKNINEQHGLEVIKNYDDEYDIQRKFHKALEIGKIIINKLDEFTKNNNQLGIERCNRIIDACFTTFYGHFWGEDYINELTAYKNNIINTSNLIKNDTVYERAIKTYGSGNSNTEYYPIMENGSMVVQKTSVNGIATLTHNYGVIDNSKNEIVPCIYDSCEPINENYFIVGKDYTSGGIIGDDYSFPKQVYGIVDSNGNTIVPIKMSFINNKNGYISIRGFDDKYYIGQVNDDNLTIREGLSYTVSDSLEDIFKAIQGTNKITIIGQNFILKDGDYSTIEEFKNAYYDSFDIKNNQQKINDESAPKHK